MKIEPCNGLDNSGVLASTVPSSEAVGQPSPGSRRCLVGEVRFGAARQANTGGGVDREPRRQHHGRVLQLGLRGTFGGHEALIVKVQIDIQPGPEAAEAVVGLASNSGLKESWLQPLRVGISSVFATSSR